MWKAVVAIVLIFVVVIAVSAMFSQDTLRYAVGEASSYAQRPDSAVEIALQGQQLYADTHEDSSGGTRFGLLLGMVVVFFLIFIMVAGGGYLYLRTNYLKQSRLNKKSSKRAASPRVSAPRVSVLPTAEMPESRTLGRSRSAAYLEDGREEYQSYDY